MNGRLVIIIGILSLAVVSGFAVVIGDSHDVQYEPIETADDNPEVRERGVFRLLASNDIDEDETATHPDIFNVSARNIQTRRAGNNSTETVIRLDNTTFTTEQARQYSRLTDGYRERLDTRTRIPTEDTWQNGSNVTIEDASFIGFEGNTTEPERSGEDGVVYVEIASEPGQLPARNVEVLQEEVTEEDSSAELYIANPDEIEVYDGEMKSYEEINRDAVENSFLETGVNRSVVPAVGYGSDTARYNTTSANISGKWHESAPAIKDHYVGIARITEGALYDDFWIVNPDGIEVTALHDYRAAPPYTKNDEYTEDTTCTYQDGNDTETATAINYEYYKNPTVENDFTELYHNGSWYDERNSTNVVPIEDPASGKITPYSTVTIKFTHVYGTRYPDKCPDSDTKNTETVEVTSTYSRDAEHPIEPAKADGLAITAYVKDTRQSQELYFEIYGDQRPEENPLGTMQITANGGDNKWTVHSPWIVFSQSLYDRVETRQTSYNEWNYTTVEVDDGPHNLHRDYMDANGYKTSARSTILVNERGIDQAQTYEGINTGENVINTKGDVPLYRTWGGRVISTSSGGRLQDFNASAKDIFGNEIDVDTEFITYEPTQMELDTQDDSTVAVGRLVDSNGSGVPNREIHIEGGETDRVITDPDGSFQVQIKENASRVSAEFEEDKLRENVDTHYEGARAEVFTGTPDVSLIATPLGYLSTFVSNLLVVAHWIALGLFFVGWIKFRNDD